MLNKCYAEIRAFQSKTDSVYYSNSDRNILRTPKVNRAKLGWQDTGMRLWFADVGREVHPVSEIDFFKIGLKGQLTESEKEEQNQVTKRIRTSLGISKKDAISVQMKLFEEIEKMNESRKGEHLSDSEKAQIVLAVIKTADSLLKQTPATK
jgi:hypothetical protein